MKTKFNVCVSRKTAKLVAAGVLLGVPVVDHIIVTDDGQSFSFLEHGLLGGAQ